MKIFYLENIITAIRSGCKKVKSLTYLYSTNKEILGIEDFVCKKYKTQEEIVN